MKKRTWPRYATRIKQKTGEGGAIFGQFWVKEPRQFRKNISHEKRHLYRVARVIFQVCVQRIFDQTKVSVRNAVS